LIGGYVDNLIGSINCLIFRSDGGQGFVETDFLPPDMQVKMAIGCAAAILTQVGERTGLERAMELLESMINSKGKEMNNNERS
jgi:hypothetical protein